MKKSNSKKYVEWRKRVDYKNDLKAWSKIVRDRDGNKCAVCGGVDYLNAHHVLEKIYFREHSLDPNIGITLCPRHHKYGPASAHMNGLWFSEWLRKNRLEQFNYCISLLDKEEFTKLI